LRMLTVHSMMTGQGRMNESQAEYPYIFMVLGALVSLCENSMNNPG